MMRSTYNPEDVTLLLSDITGRVQPLPAQERERLIQSGAHYCEMLPIEYVPTSRYMEIYQQALHHYAADTAHAVGRLAEKIIAKKGTDVVLVSLARAGTPIGILLKRYFRKKHAICVKHYSVSIIRGKGIDNQAMQYLLHRYRPEQLQFIDGWIGKGAILTELNTALQPYPGVSPELGVVADPAGMTRLYGTQDDILIPSSCLNCTVCGLISRTFLRDDIIGKNDFHGAVFYKELKDADLSYEFIHAIEEKFILDEMPGEYSTNQYPPDEYSDKKISLTGLEEAKKIAGEFNISDINKIKPGIGETTRVLLRRVPWKILIDPRCQKDDALAHIYRLAQEKQVPVELYSMEHYKTCGIIKTLADT